MNVGEWESNTWQLMLIIRIDDRCIMFMLHFLHTLEVHRFNQPIRWKKNISYIGQAFRCVHRPGSSPPTLWSPWTFRLATEQGVNSHGKFGRPDHHFLKHLKSHVAVEFFDVFFHMWRCSRWRACWNLTLFTVNHVKYSGKIGTKTIVSFQVQKEPCDTRSFPTRTIPTCEGHRPPTRLDPEACALGTCSRFSRNDCSCPLKKDCFVWTLKILL